MFKILTKSSDIHCGLAQDSSKDLNLCGEDVFKARCLAVFFHLEPD